MLATQQNKIRWMGIDMRSRRRRRIAIVVTYLALVFAAGWLEEWHGDGWLTPVKALFGILFAAEFLTIFRDGGLVKSFEVRSKPFDGFTNYDIFRNFACGKWKFVRTKNLPPGIQTYGLGSVGQPMDDHAVKNLSPEAPDERECMQRDQASRLTLRFLAFILACNAVNAGMNGKSWNPPVEVAFILSYLVIARTGPKAYILWHEPDPRDIPGELELVPSATEN